MNIDLDGTQIAVALITGGLALIGTLVQRGNRDQAKRQDRLVDFVVKLDDKVDALDSKVDQVVTENRETRAEVETIRRHQLLDVLAGRHRSMRSWRRLLYRGGLNDD